MGISGETTARHSLRVATPLISESGFIPEVGFIPEGEVGRPGIQYGALDRVVSPGYFEAMRIPLRRERLFDNRDGPSAPASAVINETMERKFWRNENALGKRFRLNIGNGNFGSFQIVAIVGDVRQMGLDAAPKKEMYFPYWQGARELYDAPRPGDSNCQESNGFGGRSAQNRVSGCAGPAGFRRNDDGRYC